MNFKYFAFGFFSVFGLHSFAKELPKHKGINQNISSYFVSVGNLMKKVFNEQSEKLQAK